MKLNMLNRGSSVWQKPKDFFSQIPSFFFLYEKDTTKDSKGRTVDKKPWRYTDQTEPNREGEIRYLKTGQWQQLHRLCRKWVRKIKRWD